MCLYELENITKSQRECEKMKVNEKYFPSLKIFSQFSLVFKLVTRPKTNQIVANYITEELKIGLTLTLPVNYPLAQVCVEAPDRVIVSNDKWRSWMFQLITCQVNVSGKQKKFTGCESFLMIFRMVAFSTDYFYGNDALTNIWKESKIVRFA